jgi:hypothetical protein
MAVKVVRESFVLKRPNKIYLLLEKASLVLKRPSKNYLLLEKASQVLIKVRHTSLVLKRPYFKQNSAIEVWRILLC